MTARICYVISDLHIGGELPGPETEGSARGFRMCTRVDALARFIRELATKAQRTELVINGDFVDFLAERHAEAPHWRPFLADQELAMATFEKIVARDASVFEALREFVAARHQLTILVGNHDLELTLPAVRACLERTLSESGGASPPIRFIYDGEPYVIGDAIIEHGNRYDAFNVVNHDALRRLRSALARRILGEVRFSPPVGSALVSNVMNDLKVKYSFIDLLKPEDRTVAALLLAMEPELRTAIGQLIPYVARSRRHRLRSPLIPVVEGEIARASRPDGVARASGRRAGRELEELLTESELTSGEELDADDQIAATSTDWWLGLAALTIGTGAPPERTARISEPRLRRLHGALRGVQRDRSFDWSYEGAAEYHEAARALFERGFRFVVFGHTHLAKCITDGARTYLNSGTWADVLQVPADALHEDYQQAEPHLRRFLGALQSGDLSALVASRPTYVRLEISRTGSVVSGELLEYPNALTAGGGG